MTPRILIIAGSDSGGGAGIQADIKTVTMLGGHAMTAITAITAQNTLGVTGVHAVPTEMVLAQIDACVTDIGVDAIKIGMIGSARTALALAEKLGELPGVPVVFDPVMVATSGAALADEDLHVAIRARRAVPALGALGPVEEHRAAVSEMCTHGLPRRAEHRLEVEILPDLPVLAARGRRDRLLQRHTV